MVEGFWKVAVSTPLGTRNTVLELFTENGVLRGISHGEKEKLTLQDLEWDGSRLTWYQSITKPMRMNLIFSVVIEGDELNGTAKGGPMPASKVSGRRESAPHPA
jgi:hypothetical protein